MATTCPNPPPPGLKTNLGNVCDEALSLIIKMEHEGRLDWRHQAAERAYKQYCKELPNHPVLKLPEVIALDFKVTFNTNLEGRYDANGEKWMRTKLGYCVKLRELNSWLPCARDDLSHIDWIEQYTRLYSPIARFAHTAHAGYSLIMSQLKNGELLCAEAAGICQKLEVSTRWFEIENQRLLGVKNKLDFIQLCLRVSGCDTVDDNDGTKCEHVGKQEDNHVVDAEVGQ